MKLRDYQEIASADAVKHLTTGTGLRLYAAPTGSGKSVIELDVQAKTGAWIVTPKIEILVGMLEKSGENVRELGEDALLALAWERHMTTPIRLRNRLLEGADLRIHSLILDESHHDEADSWLAIHTLVGHVPTVGYTATPYRGTAKSTAEFRKRWGEAIWIITYPEAVARRVISIPTCRTIPLVDDDLLETAGGEFVVSQVNDASRTKLGDVVSLCQPFVANLTWDKPTLFALPSRDLAHMLAERLNSCHLSCQVVTAKTVYNVRQSVFASCVERKLAILQVSVVGEGVDLPIRRIVDLSPAVSPVKWLQQFGRVTRFSEDKPEYICCNRNLARHGYLLDGCIPREEIADAQRAFRELPKRTGSRAFGLESLGRLHAVPLRLLSGVLATCYAVTATDGHRSTDYFVVVHPCEGELRWARRERESEAGQTVRYGKWRACHAPEALEGFASSRGGEPSPKQQAWWKRAAESRGLDPSQPCNRKSFSALPVLIDTGWRL